jgi:hypothetical protein
MAIKRARARWSQAEFFWGLLFPGSVLYEEEPVPPRPRQGHLPCASQLDKGVGFGWLIFFWLLYTSQTQSGT